MFWKNFTGRAITEKCRKPQRLNCRIGYDIMSAPCDWRAERRQSSGATDAPSAKRLASLSELLLRFEQKQMFLYSDSYFFESEGRRNHEKEIRQTALSVSKFKAGYRRNAYHYTASRFRKACHGTGRTGAGFIAMLINLKTSDSNSKAISEYLYDVTSDMDETISFSVIYNPLPRALLTAKARSCGIMRNLMSW